MNLQQKADASANGFQVILSSGPTGDYWAVLINNARQEQRFGTEDQAWDWIQKFLDADAYNR